MSQENIGIEIYNVGQRRTEDTYDMGEIKGKVLNYLTMDLEYGTYAKEKYQETYEEALLKLEKIKENDFDMSEVNKEKIIERALEIAAKAIEYKYNLKTIGTSCNADDESVSKFSLLIHINENLSKSEIRKALINASNELVNQLNNNQEIHFFKCFPFNQKNAEIRIHNINQEAQKSSQPYIRLAKISEYEIEFLEIDTKCEKGYRIESENYKEAEG